MAYLHAANDPDDKRDPGEVKKALIEEGKGPLWQAYELAKTSIVLLDEIDKAPRDFPNDLLNAIDQHQFTVKELRKTIECGKNPPMLVITSNSERRLPEPFLRRCIMHHIEFDDSLIERAVSARRGDFPNLDRELEKEAIARFVELRGYDLRKRPATAELLTWLAILSARGDTTSDQLTACPLRELPALSALIKDRDDLAMLP